MSKLNVFLKLLVLTMVQVFGDTKAILIATSDDVEYVDGKSTGRVRGTKYDVVCPAMRYMGVTVKVPLPAVISQEQIDSAASTGTQIWITFEGFKGRLYIMDGNLGLSCKADSASVVQTGKEKG